MILQKLAFLIVLIQPFAYANAEELDDLLADPTIKESGVKESGTFDEIDSLEKDLDKPSVKKAAAHDELDSLEAEISKPAGKEKNTVAAPVKTSEAEKMLELEDEIAADEIPSASDTLVTRKEKNIAKFYSKKQRINDKDWEDKIGKSFDEVYIISQGDTLWTISEKFLDSPWYWSKIWELNAYITNPHQIYPGNEIRFRFSAEEGPSISLVQTDSSKEAQEEKTTDYSQLEREVVADKFDKLGFYRPALSKFSNYSVSINSNKNNNLVYLGAGQSFKGSVNGMLVAEAQYHSGEKVLISVMGDCKIGDMFSVVQEFNSELYEVTSSVEVESFDNGRCIAKIRGVYNQGAQGSKLISYVHGMLDSVSSENNPLVADIISFDSLSGGQLKEGDRFFLKFTNSEAPVPGTLIFLYDFNPDQGMKAGTKVLGVGKLVYSFGNTATASLIASSGRITQKPIVSTRF